jgi:hypothetical protein
MLTAIRRSQETEPAARTRTANCRSWFVVAAVAWLFATGSAPVQATTQEVVFRVGDNASIDWFAIDDPASMHGTLNVTNAPYDNTTQLNSAAVDLSLNRLVYGTNTGTVQGYAINLTGLNLVQNGVTPVTLTALGLWPGGGVNDNAGYRKNDGKVYFHPKGSDQLRTLDFDPITGLITGVTNVGKFNGSNAPNSITGGDIDFSADGSIWLSGDNDTIGVGRHSKTP